MPWLSTFFSDLRTFLAVLIWEKKGQPYFISISPLEEMVLCASLLWYENKLIVGLDTDHWVHAATSELRTLSDSVQHMVHCGILGPLIRTSLVKGRLPGTTAHFPLHSTLWPLHCQAQKWGPDQKGGDLVLTFLWPTAGLLIARPGSVHASGNFWPPVDW